MNKQLFTTLAIVSFLVALISTGIGGWSDMLGTSFVVSKQHAWNDGIVMMLMAIFFLMLAKL